MKDNTPGCEIGSEFAFGHSGGYQIGLCQSPGDRFQRATLTANGRASLGLAARYARLSTADQRNTILLPAYLCRSMIQPFLEVGLRVRFYPVRADLSISAAEVCERIDDSTLAVLLMHYFGFPQSDDLASVLRDRYPHLTIIDDRTHLLISDLLSETAPSGTAVAVYSARKWGPFPDLGVVIWPEDNPAIENNRLLDGGYDFSFGSLRFLGIALRALFFAWPSDALRRLSLMPFHKADNILDNRVLIRSASPVSGLLWKFWDWMRAWNVRRENYQYLLSNWPSADLDPLFKRLPKSVCPLGFPIRIRDRNRIKEHLISKGVFPPIHWLKPPEVSRDEFPDAAVLSEQELTIPIDQRYGARQMDCILDAICHT